MQIYNFSVASLFQQTQAGESGVLSGASFGADPTGQNLPTVQAGASATAAASPLSVTPSSQFASGVLSALLAAQAGASTPQAAQSFQQAGLLSWPGGRHHHHHRFGAASGVAAASSTVDATSQASDADSVAAALGGSTAAAT
ncbi:MAG TPA: hypothetical protein VN805_02050 [Caulobacteraceae bacterium]|nr:hypothetical protein [Caulobacteraceae bacterium]